MNMRIGELADELGINTKTLRFYESVGVLPEPARTTTGYRQYGRADAERVIFVKTAQRLGMSLDEIREILAFRDRGEPPCDYVRTVLDRQVAEIDERLAELVRLREQLAVLQSEAEQLTAIDGGGCYCGIIEHARPPASDAIARRHRLER